MPELEKNVTIHREPLYFLNALHDIFCVIISAFFLNFLLFQDWKMEAHYIVSTATIAFIIGLMNLNSNFILTFRASLILQILWRFILFWLISYGAVDSIFNLLSPEAGYKKYWVIYTLITSFILLMCNRLFFSLIVWRARSKGKYRRSVFLIGSSESVSSLGKRMRYYSSEGFSIAGVQRLNDSPNQSNIENILERVRESNAAEVWISLPLEMGKIVKTLLFQLRNETAEIRFLPTFSDESLLNHRASEVVGRYSIDLSVTPISGQARLIKRLEDILLSLVITAIVLPICLIIAVAIKLTSSGPVLFTQYRTGVSGHHFKVYKFRTMKVHTEENGITQAVINDMRTTKLGAFLRKTSLDEFPQLINVLQGNMSLVGPRPHALSHNEHYKNLVESYMRRHMVKPGITGWAQVSGYRGQTDTLDKMKKRVEHDLWYIDNWSILLDLKIIVLTIFKGFVHKNAY